MLTVILAAAAVFLVLERVVPDVALPYRRTWYPRALSANLAQLSVVVLTGVTLDRWLEGWSLVSLAHLPVWQQGVVGYLLTTFVYYFWHRARHDSNLLWLLCHQLHHSPARIEVLTSFYKHPIELLLNALISAILAYLVLGLSVEGAAWVTLLSALGEFFYHMNVRTPRWLGYVFQRPEMHRVHHQLGRHYDNFSDLPLWDMLFGTFHNPDRHDGPCGFQEPREQQVGTMLRCRNVNGPLPAAHAWQTLKSAARRPRPGSP